MPSKAQLLFALLFAVVISVGCTSQWAVIAPRPPQDYEVLGRAHGEATWRMFFDGTALNFMPAGLSDRTRLAYEEAIASVPGATALVNVTIQERWASWYLWSSKTITVTGDAVRSR